MSRILYSFITLIFLAIFIWGCGNPDSGQDAGESDDGEVTAEGDRAGNGTSVDGDREYNVDDGIEYERFTGYLIYGPRMSYFKNSPGGEYFMARDDTRLLKDIYGELTSMQDEPIYVVIEGEMKQVEGEDVPDDYPNFLYIKNVLEADYVSKDNPIFDFEFFCFGQEPFWAVDIIRDDEVILRDIGTSTVTYFFYSKPEIVGDEIIYEFELSRVAAPGNLIVHITRESCVDSMSGEEYEYSAMVILGDTTFTGCAEKPETSQP